MEEEFETNLSNAYGTVGFRKNDDVYTIFLNDWSGEDEVTISEAMYIEAKKVFTKNEK